MRRAPSFAKLHIGKFRPRVQRDGRALFLTGNTRVLELEQEYGDVLVQRGALSWHVVLTDFDHRSMFDYRCSCEAPSGCAHAWAALLAVDRASHQAKAAGASAGGHEVEQAEWRARIESVKRYQLPASPRQESAPTVLHWWLQVAQPNPRTLLRQMLPQHPMSE